MIFAKKAVFFFLLIIVGFEESKAVVYKVGDSAGWTNSGQVDYKTWANTKNFHVGDILVFDYNKQFHNVVRVTHKNFNSCNSTVAYETFATGNDSFVIKKTGHFFFICSSPGHCESGQKVDIRVPAVGPVVSPSPTPYPTPNHPPISTPPSSTPPFSAPVPPRSPAPISTPSTPPSSQPVPPRSPSPEPVPPRSPAPISPPTPPSQTVPPKSSAPISPPTPPSSQTLRSPPPSISPSAYPPVNYEAPAPSPNSGSSLIYSSKGLIMLSTLVLASLFGIGW